MMLSRLLFGTAVLLAAAAPLGPVPIRAAPTTPAVPAPPIEVPAPHVPATQAAVTIDNFSFTPATLTIPPGTEVTWTNHDDIPHTVVIPDPSQAFKSPVLDTDDHVTVTFGRPGTYKYFCSLHPHMQGTVIVQ